MKEKSLCHYTNLSGMMGIISSGGLWATNLLFLNDRSELKHGLDCACKCLEFLDPETYNFDWREDYIEAVREIETYDIYELFAICFCRNADLLSQWRGYGGGQQGISIVFDEIKLINIIKDRARPTGSFEDESSIRLDNYLVHTDTVIYSDEQQTFEFKNKISELWNNYPEYVKSLDDESSQNEFSYIKYMIGRVAPFFKHRGFEEEEEFRVLIRNLRGAEAVNFRQNGKLVIPYLDIGLSSLGKLPITKIVIGPSEDFESVKKSLRYFLDVKGYPFVALEKSKIPFRN